MRSTVQVLPESRPCPLCGSVEAQQLFQPESSPGPIVRCKECELVYASPLLNQQAIIQDGPVIGNSEKDTLASTKFEEFRECWEMSLLPAKLEEWPVGKLSASKVLDRIENLVRPPGRLLDFGCGWGFFLGLAKERGWDTFGIEPLPAHAAHARDIFAASVVTDTLRQDTFASRSFDLITAFQVFEHLPDPRENLLKLHAALKVGGVIHIAVPNIDTWGVRLLGKRHRHFVQDHLTFFSPMTLQELLRGCGFRIFEVSYPARNMTVRHLVTVWMARYLPAAVIRLIEAVCLRLSLWERILSLNLGDIVAVTGRRED